MTDNQPWYAAATMPTTTAMVARIASNTTTTTTMQRCPLSDNNNLIACLKTFSTAPARTRTINQDNLGLEWASN